MIKIDADAALAATLPKDVPTLADAIARIVGDERLSVTRRRDMASALRSIARALGRPPEILPASTRWLQPRLERLHPEQLGISAKRWSNIASDAAAGLRHLGLARRVIRSRNEPLPPAWAKLAASIEDSTALHCGLSRFIGFCARLSVPPEQVDDNILAAYQEALTHGLLLKRPMPLVQQVILRWNEASARIPGWPSRRLSHIDRRQTFGLDWETFPESFRLDLDRWLVRLSGSDLLASNAPETPLAPATLKHRRHQIRAIASACCHAGLELDRIVDLSVLARPDNLRLGLNWLLQRNGNKPSGAIHGVAIMIKGLARHYVGVDDQALNEIRGICRRLDPGSSGLTEKNRTRLRQFNDPANVALLLNLSGRLMREAEAGPANSRSALKAQSAIAITLLLIAPIRLRNLAALDLERHICRNRGHETFLVIDRSEVKNRQDLEFPLPANAVACLDDYVTRFLPLLTKAPTSLLFPRRDGDGSKAPGQLSSQITREIFRLTGLKVHVHLFRHIAAKLYLDVHPGGYEVIRRVLGHRSMDTTIRAYTGLEGAAAARHFDAVIEGLRQNQTATRRRARRKPVRR